MKIKKLCKSAVIPVKKSKSAIGYDLELKEDISIEPGRNCIGMGFAIEIPIGYEGKIEPRSGNSLKGIEACKAPLTLKERADIDVLVGKIDPDYRGELGVIIKNNTPFKYTLLKGLNIAQITFYKTEDITFEEVEKLSETDRGKGGFGSTDKNPKEKKGDLDKSIIEK